MLTVERTALSWSARSAIVAALGLLVAAGALGCAGAITPQPGPIFVDPNGYARLGVSVAGKEAGGPCLQGPICLVPSQGSTWNGRGVLTRQGEHPSRGGAGKET